jgi:FMN phosphatase YigB (HAD superfamily)
VNAAAAAADGTYQSAASRPGRRLAGERMANEPERRPLAFLVDAHGTLFHEHPPRHLIYAAAALRHGHATTADAVAGAMATVHDALPRTIDGHYRYTESWFRVFVAEVMARIGFCGDLDAITVELIAAFRARTTFRPFAEARAVIKRLRGAGVPMAVVSNWGPHLPGVLGLIGFHGDFDAVIASGLAHVEKPDSAIFLKAARALGVPIEDCLHVGDHEQKDYEGALAAGASALWLRRDGTATDARTITSLEDVLAHFGLPRL